LAVSATTSPLLVLLLLSCQLQHWYRRKFAPATAADVELQREQHKVDHKEPGLMPGVNEGPRQKPWRSN